MPDLRDLFETTPTVDTPSLNLAQRNNNPGNLRDPATRQFRVFKTQEDGWRALRDDLTAKITGKSAHGIGPVSSLRDFAAIWAPQSEKPNNPEAYAGRIAEMLRVTPDTPIGRLH